MGSHQKTVGSSEVWLTPPEIIHNLGPFDLDPCAAPSPRPWHTATKHVCLPEDGLAAEWSGRVWLNPPYGLETSKWMERLARHNYGTALIFARTETETWHRWVWPVASGILFLRGRITFRFPNGARAKGTAGAPSALVAYGPEDYDRLRASAIAGAFVCVERGAAR